MQLKQYMAPTTDVFTFGPNERLMDEPIIMAGSPSMPNPAPIRNPLD
ncbi:MAG: hypothetical protein IJT12_07645 [Paludibacteraceae bacterium]|nr:hypothetical protein [Paludibacteraceae bacterium]